ncbi:MAG: DUF4292 domain-containing protein [Desulfobacterales bacterium]
MTGKLGIAMDDWQRNLTGAFRVLRMGVAVFLFVSCSGLGGKMLPPPVVSPEAQHRLSLLENHNRGLGTFKGMGSFRLENQEGLRHARVAWIGSDFRKLRIQVMDISGLPIISIAADGDSFCALSHRENRFYKTRSSDPSLEKAIGIPMKTREAIQILTGRVPIRGHDSAVIVRDEKGDILVLTSRWGRVLEKIYFDKDGKTVLRMELYDSMGNSVYQAQFGEIRNVENYRLPFDVKVLNEEVHFHLRTERFWADMPVSPSIFVIEDPEKRK